MRKGMSPFPAKKILLFLLILALCIPAVSAEFTQTFDTSTDTVHYNISTRWSTESTTPDWIWRDITFLGIGLFLLTLILKLEHGIDIIAILAMVPLGFSFWMTLLGLDTITSFGVASLDVAGTPTWVLMENHVINSPLEITVYLFCFWLISLVNIYRIYMIGGFGFIKKLRAGRGDNETV